LGNAQGAAILASGIIGYGMYLGLLVYQLALNKCKFNCMKVTYLKDFVYLVTFVSVVAVWRFLWDGFDYLVIDTPYQTHIIVGTHVATFLLLFLLQCGTIIYGPGGLSSSSSLEDADEECSVREYLEVNEKIKFYDIEYFALQNS
jgi:hypothetical protein